MANQLVNISVGVILKPFDRAVAHIKNTINILNKQRISIFTVQGAAIATAGATGAAFAASALAIKGLVDALGKFISIIPRAAFAANDLVMKVHQIKVAFQAAFPTVTREIDALAYKIGFSRSELTGLAADLGPMLHGMGKTEAESAALTKELLKLGAGAAFVHDIELPQFMNLLEAGVEGSTKAFQKLNIFMTPFQVELEAFRMAGRGQIAMNEEQQLSWARLSLAMKQLRNQAVQNGWAQKQLGGTFRETRGRLNDLLLSFGEIIKPVFSRMFTRINQILQDMNKWFGKNKQVVQEWVGSFVDGVVTALSSWEEFKKAIGKAWGWVWGGIKEGFMSVWNWITDYIVASMEHLGDVISAVIMTAIWGGDAKVRGVDEIVAKRRAARGMLAAAGDAVVKNLLPRDAGAQAKIPDGPLAGAVIGGRRGGAPAAVGGAAAEIGGGFFGLRGNFPPKDVPAAGAGAPGGAPAPRKLANGRLDPKDFIWAGGKFMVIPGHEAKVKADREEMKARAQRRKAGGGGGGGGGDEGEPTPRFGAVRPGMGQQAPSFVGIAEFAKKIQLDAFGDQDKQLNLLARIAHNGEFLNQIMERQQAMKGAFGRAAGPK